VKDANDAKDAKDANDVVYAVMTRVRALADRPVKELRALAGFDGMTREEAIRAHKYEDRAELLELIVTEEFIVENPKRFEE
jgi:hypothetical protein